VINQQRQPKAAPEREGFLMAKGTTTSISTETHEIYWLKPGRVLFVNYKGHQTSDTIKRCLDDMAAEFDKVDHPVVVLINWLEVTQSDTGALFKQRGHRAYSHPMAARGVLVGFDPQEAFENEVTAVNTRRSKNTQYFHTMKDAMDYIQPMLEMA
jgi:hypothetical protein